MSKGYSKQFLLLKGSISKQYLEVIINPVYHKSDYFHPGQLLIDVLEATSNGSRIIRVIKWKNRLIFNPSLNIGIFLIILIVALLIYPPAIYVIYAQILGLLIYAVSEVLLNQFVEIFIKWKSIYSEDYFNKLYTQHVIQLKDHKRYNKVIAYPQDWRLAVVEQNTGNKSPKRVSEL